MRVDIEELEKINQRREEINSVELDDIKWFYKDREFIPPKKEVEAWKFTGLSNTEFPFYSTIKKNVCTCSRCTGGVDIESYYKEDNCQDDCSDCEFEAACPDVKP